MLIDDTLEFGDNADAATEAGTTIFGSTIDMSGVGANRQIADGHPLYLNITVGVAGDGGATATGTTAFRLVSDAVDPPLVDGTETVHLTTPTYLGTALTAGRKLSFPIPSGGTFERYVALQIVQAVEGEDDLTIDASISERPHTGQVFYPDAAN